jgi:hypothetical protein
MPFNPKLTNLAANTSANGVSTLLSGGWIRIYDGAQPATADTAITTQVLLASIRLATPAFGAAVAGVAPANAVTPDLDIDANGNATWFRAYKSDGTTPVYDGSVGLLGCDLNLSSVTFLQHGSVTITQFSYQQPLG